ncbi:MAG: PAS domain S-box protein [Candidatus Acidiferrales bacterium]
MSAAEKDRTNAPSKQEQMERNENQLWRVSLLFVVLLATGFLAVSWQTFQSLPVRLEALPLGILVLSILFGAYTWTKRRELNELRGFVRGLQATAAAPPTEKQFDQLLDMVSRSQRGYRDLIDSLDHLVFTLSLSGDIQLVNRRFVEILGLQFGEVIHHQLDEFILEPTRIEVEPSLARFLEKHSWSGVIRTRLRKTGEVRYFDCILHAVLEDGRVTAAAVLARDITAERESEARFSELFESLQEGVYCTTPEGKILDANPAFVRMLGYESKEGLLAIEAQDLHPDPTSRSRLLAELETRGSFNDQETVLLRKDGTPILCMNSATCTRDLSGQITRIQGTLMDITSRREAEKKLREEQDFIRQLIASFPDAIVVLDSERRITYASRRIEDLTGLMPGELVGTYISDRTFAEDQPSLLSAYDALIAGTQSYAQLEYRSLHRDGSWRTIRADASPLFDAAGKIAGVVASAHDVTESKRLEQQSIQREKLAAMGQMVAGVAHELNNPLTAILGVSDLLHERATDDQTRRQTNLVHQQARRAAQIVQGLLAFSRPAATSRTRVQLESVVQRALDLQNHSMSQYNISVDFQAAQNLPPVDGDSNQLLQVFLNLLTNAEQAIREVRNHGTIRVRVGHSIGLVWALIQDDGAGIRPEVLPKIFDPFFTTKRPGGGTGLGLTISMTLVKEHEGTIEVQPAPGEGCVFRVVLPAASRVELPPVPRVAPASSPLRGHSILVIDDEEGIRELIHAGMSARGLTVECVATSEEGLQRLSGKNYDAILCDYHLPGMNGDIFFKHVLADLKIPAQKFIFMTGEVLEAAALKEFTRPGAHVVQKPFQLSDLAALLAEICEPVASRAG